MSKNLLSELSLLPNLSPSGTLGTQGTTGTFGTTTTKPGSKIEAIKTNTQNLTKQINDLTQKIARVKQEAIKASQGDQTQYNQALGLLQQQLQNLIAAENEEKPESVKKVAKQVYKTVSKGTGEVMGARTGVPLIGDILGKIGEYNAEQMSKFLGIDDDEDAEGLSSKVGQALKTGGKFAWQAAKPHMQQAASKISADLIAKVLKKFNIETGATPEEIAKEIAKMPVDLGKQAFYSAAKTPGAEKVRQKVTTGEEVKSLVQKLKSAYKFNLSPKEIAVIESDLEQAIARFENLGESVQTLTPILEWAPVIGAIARVAGPTVARTVASTGLKQKAKTAATHLGSNIALDQATKMVSNMNKNKPNNINNSEDQENMKSKKKPCKKVTEGIGTATLGGVAGGLIGGLPGAAIGAMAGGAAPKAVKEIKGAMKNTENEEKKVKGKKKKTYKVAEMTTGGVVKKGLGGAAGGLLGGALGAATGIPLAGVAGSVLGTGVGAELMDEDEQNFEKLTPIQDEVVDALVKNKYYINRVSYQYAEEEGGPTVFMSKKPNKYSTRYAEVGPDGFVNGESIEDFLKGHEENEEKMLSKKQQRIAQMAGDPNKIDAADFAALKNMKKESAEIPTFLKSILQKNYAKADKYLGSIVNEKIKNLINNTLDKNTKL